MTRSTLALLPLLLVACPRAELAGHGQREAAHEEHDHGESQERYDRTLAARAGKRRCEHGEKVLACDECRYEVGAVQVPASLLSGGEERLIRTARVAASPSGGELTLTGEVGFDERRVVHISPLVEGVARQVTVTLGDTVKRGQVLARIESRELGQLRSRLQQARARLALAGTELERERRLFDEKISSGKERARAEAEHKRARIALEGVQDQLRLLGLSGAGGAGRMVIRSPRAGTVVAKHVVPGESVSPAREIFTVADLNRVWVWASVYERDLAPLLRAQAARALAARVTVAAFTGRVFTGRVDYVGATMDEATRTVKVRVAVDNDDGALRPGMFADIAIGLGEGHSELLVPAEAVLSDGERRFVFVRHKGRRFLRRDVRVGPERGGKVRVASGLSVGEEIAVQGAFLLKSDVLREKMGAGCAD